MKDSRIEVQILLKEFANPNFLLNPIAKIDFRPLSVEPPAFPLDTSLKSLLRVKEKEEERLNEPTKPSSDLELEAQRIEREEAWCSDRFSDRDR